MHFLNYDRSTGNSEMSRDRRTKRRSRWLKRLLAFGVTITPLGGLGDLFGVAVDAAPLRARKRGGKIRQTTKNSDSTSTRPVEVDDGSGTAIGPDDESAEAAAFSQADDGAATPLAGAGSSRTEMPQPESLAAPASQEHGAAPETPQAQAEFRSQQANTGAPALVTALEESRDFLRKNIAKAKQTGTQEIRRGLETTAMATVLRKSAAGSSAASKAESERRAAEDVRTLLDAIGSVVTRDDTMTLHGHDGHPYDEQGPKRYIDVYCRRKHEKTLWQLLKSKPRVTTMNPAPGKKAGSGERKTVFDLEDVRLRHNNAFSVKAAIDILQSRLATVKGTSGIAENGMPLFRLRIGTSTLSTSSRETEPNVSLLAEVSVGLIDSDDLGLPLNGDEVYRLTSLAKTAAAVQMSEKVAAGGNKPIAAGEKKVRYLQTTSLLSNSLSNCGTPSHAAPPQSGSTASAGSSAAPQSASAAAARRSTAAPVDVTKLGLEGRSERTDEFLRDMQVKIGVLRWLRANIQSILAATVSDDALAKWIAEKSGMTPEQALSAWRELKKHIQSDLEVEASRRGIGRHSEDGGRAVVDVEVDEERGVAVETVMFPGYRLETYVPGRGAPGMTLVNGVGCVDVAAASGAGSSTSGAAQGERGDRAGRRGSSRMTKSPPATQSTVHPKAPRQRTVPVDHLDACQRSLLHDMRQRIAELFFPDEAGAPDADDPLTLARRGELEAAFLSKTDASIFLFPSNARKMMGLKQTPEQGGDEAVVLVPENWSDLSSRLAEKVLGLSLREATTFFPEDVTTEWVRILTQLAKYEVDLGKACELDEEIGEGTEADAEARRAAREKDCLFITSLSSEQSGPWDGYHATASSFVMDDNGKSSGAVAAEGGGGGRKKASRRSRALVRGGSAASSSGGAQQGVLVDPEEHVDDAFTVVAPHTRGTGEDLGRSIQEAASDTLTAFNSDAATQETRQEALQSLHRALASADNFLKQVTGDEIQNPSLTGVETRGKMVEDRAHAFVDALVNGDEQEHFGKDPEAVSKLKRELPAAFRQLAGHIEDISRATSEARAAGRTTQESPLTKPPANLVQTLRELSEVQVGDRPLKDIAMQHLSKELGKMSIQNQEEYVMKTHSLLARLEGSTASGDIDLHRGASCSSSIISEQSGARRVAAEHDGESPQERQAGEEAIWLDAKEDATESIDDLHSDEADEAHEDEHARSVMEHVYDAVVYDPQSATASETAATWGFAVPCSQVSVPTKSRGIISSDGGEGDGADADGVSTTSNVTVAPTEEPPIEEKKGSRGTAGSEEEGRGPTTPQAQHERTYATSGTLDACCRKAQQEESRTRLPPGRWHGNNTFHEIKCAECGRACFVDAVSETEHQGLQLATKIPLQVDPRRFRWVYGAHPPGQLRGLVLGRRRVNGGDAQEQASCSGGAAAQEPEASQQQLQKVVNTICSKFGVGQADVGSIAVVGARELVPEIGSDVATVAFDRAPSPGGSSLVTSPEAGAERELCCTGLGNLPLYVLYYFRDQHARDPEKWSIGIEREEVKPTDRMSSTGKRLQQRSLLHLVPNWLLEESRKVPNLPQEAQKELMLSILGTAGVAVELGVGSTWVITGREYLWESVGVRPGWNLNDMTDALLKAVHADLRLLNSSTQAVERAKTLFEKLRDVRRIQFLMRPPLPMKEQQTEERATGRGEGQIDFETSIGQSSGFTFLQQYMRNIFTDLFQHHTVSVLLQRDWPVRNFPRVVIHFADFIELLDRKLVKSNYIYPTLPPARKAVWWYSLSPGSAVDAFGRALLRPSKQDFEDYQSGKRDAASVVTAAVERAIKADGVDSHPGMEARTAKHLGLARQHAEGAVGASASAASAADDFLAKVEDMDATPSVTMFTFVRAAAFATDANAAAQDPLHRLPYYDKDEHRDVAELVSEVLAEHWRTLKEWAAGTRAAASSPSPRREGSLDVSSRTGLDAETSASEARPVAGEGVETNAKQDLHAGDHKFSDALASFQKKTLPKTLKDFGQWFGHPAMIVFPELHAFVETLKATKKVSDIRAFSTYEWHRNASPLDFSETACLERSGSLFAVNLVPTPDEWINLHTTFDRMADMAERDRAPPRGTTSSSTPAAASTSKRSGDVDATSFVPGVTAGSTYEYFAAHTREFQQQIDVRTLLAASFPCSSAASTASDAASSRGADAAKSVNLLVQPLMLLARLLGLKGYIDPVFSRVLYFTDLTLVENWRMAFEASDPEKRRASLQAKIEAVQKELKGLKKDAQSPSAAGAAASAAGSPQSSQTTTPGANKKQLRNRKEQLQQELGELEKTAEKARKITYLLQRLGTNKKQPKRGLLGLSKLIDELDADKKAKAAGAKAGNIKSKTDIGNATAAAAPSTRTGRFVVTPASSSPSAKTVLMQSGQHVARAAATLAETTTVMTPEEFLKEVESGTIESRLSRGGGASAASASSRAPRPTCEDPASQLYPSSAAGSSARCRDVAVAFHGANSADATADTITIPAAASENKAGKSKDRDQDKQGESEYAATGSTCAEEVEQELGAATSPESSGSPSSKRPILFSNLAEALEKELSRKEQPSMFAPAEQTDNQQRLKGWRVLEQTFAEEPRISDALSMWTTSVDERILNTLRLNVEYKKRIFQEYAKNMQRHAIWAKLGKPAENQPKKMAPVTFFVPVTELVRTLVCLHAMGDTIPEETVIWKRKAKGEPASKPETPDPTDWDFDATVHEYITLHRPPRPPQTQDKEKGDRTLGAARDRVPKRVVAGEKWRVGGRGCSSDAARLMMDLGSAIGVAIAMTNAELEYAHTAASKILSDGRGKEGKRKQGSSFAQKIMEIKEPGLVAGLDPLRDPLVGQNLVLCTLSDRIGLENDAEVVGEQTYVLLDAKNRRYGEDNTQEVDDAPPAEFEEDAIGTNSTASPSGPSATAIVAPGASSPGAAAASPGCMSPVKLFQSALSSVMNFAGRVTSQNGQINETPAEALVVEEDDEVGTIINAGESVSEVVDTKQEQVQGVPLTPLVASASLPADVEMLDAAPQDASSADFKMKASAPSRKKSVPSLLSPVDEGTTPVHGPPEIREDDEGTTTPTAAEGPPPSPAAKPAARNSTGSGEQGRGFPPQHLAEEYLYDHFASATEIGRATARITRERYRAIELISEERAELSSGKLQLYLWGGGTTDSPADRLREKRLLADASLLHPDAAETLDALSLSSDNGYVSQLLTEANEKIARRRTVIREKLAEVIARNKKNRMEEGQEKLAQETKRTEDGAVGPSGLSGAVDLTGERSAGARTDEVEVATHAALNTGKSVAAFASPSPKCSKRKKGAKAAAKGISVETLPEGETQDDGGAAAGLSRSSSLLSSSGGNYIGKSDAITPTTLPASSPSLSISPALSLSAYRSIESGSSSPSPLLLPTAVPGPGAFLAPGFNAASLQIQNSLIRSQDCVDGMQDVLGDDRVADGDELPSDGAEMLHADRLTRSLRHGLAKMRISFAAPSPASTSWTTPESASPPGAVDETSLRGETAEDSKAADPPEETVEQEQARLVESLTKTPKDMLRSGLVVSLRHALHESMKDIDELHKEHQAYLLDHIRADLIPEALAAWRRVEHFVDPIEYRPMRTGKDFAEKSLSGLAWKTFRDEAGMVEQPGKAGTEKPHEQHVTAQKMNFARAAARMKTEAMRLELWFPGMFGQELNRAGEGVVDGGKQSNAAAGEQWQGRRDGPGKLFDAALDRLEDTARDIDKIIQEQTLQGDEQSAGGGGGVATPTADTKRALQGGGKSSRGDASDRSAFWAKSFPDVRSLIVETDQRMIHFSQVFGNFVATYPRMAAGRVMTYVEANKNLSDHATRRSGESSWSAGVSPSFLFQRFTGEKQPEQDPRADDSPPGASGAEAGRQEKPSTAEETAEDMQERSRRVFEQIATVMMAWRDGDNPNAIEEQEILEEKALELERKERSLAATHVSGAKAKATGAPGVAAAEATAGSGATGPAEEKDLSQGEKMKREVKRRRTTRMAWRRKRLQNLLDMFELIAELAHLVLADWPKLLRLKMHVRDEGKNKNPIGQFGGNSVHGISDTMLTPTEIFPVDSEDALFFVRATLGAARAMRRELNADARDIFLLDEGLSHVTQNVYDHWFGDVAHMATRASHTLEKWNGLLVEKYGETSGTPCRSLLDKLRQKEVEEAKVNKQGDNIVSTEEERRQQLRQKVKRNLLLAQAATGKESTMSLLSGAGWEKETDEIRQCLLNAFTVRSSYPATSLFWTAKDLLQAERHARLTPGASEKALHARDMIVARMNKVERRPDAQTKRRADAVLVTLQQERRRLRGVLRDAVESREDREEDVDGREVGGLSTDAGGEREVAAAAAKGASARPKEMSEEDFQKQVEREVAAIIEQHSSRFRGKQTNVLTADCKSAKRCVNCYSKQNYDWRLYAWSDRNPRCCNEKVGKYATKMALAVLAVVYLYEDGRVTLYAKMTILLYLFGKSSAMGYVDGRLYDALWRERSLRAAQSRVVEGAAAAAEAPPAASRSEAPGVPGGNEANSTARDREKTDIEEALEEFPRDFTAFVNEVTCLPTTAEEIHCMEEHEKDAAHVSVMLHSLHRHFSRERKRDEKKMEEQKLERAPPPPFSAVSLSNHKVRGGVFGRHYALAVSIKQQQQAAAVLNRNHNWPLPSETEQRMGDIDVAVKTETSRPTKKTIFEEIAEEETRKSALGLTPTSRDLGIGPDFEEAEERGTAAALAQLEKSEFAHLVRAPLGHVSELDRGGPSPLFLDLTRAWDHNPELMSLSPEEGDTMLVRAQDASMTHARAPANTTTRPPARGAGASAMTATLDATPSTSSSSSAAASTAGRADPEGAADSAPLGRANSLLAAFHAQHHLDSLQHLHEQSFRSEIHEPWTELMDDLEAYDGGGKLPKISERKTFLKKVEEATRAMWAEQQIKRAAEKQVETDKQEVDAAGENSARHPAAGIKEPLTVDTGDGVVTATEIGYVGSTPIIELTPGGANGDPAPIDANAMSALFSKLLPQMLEGNKAPAKTGVVAYEKTGAPAGRGQKQIMKGAVANPNSIAQSSGGGGPLEEHQKPAIKNSEAAAKAKSHSAIAEDSLGERLERHKVLFSKMFDKTDSVVRTAIEATLKLHHALTRLYRLAFYRTRYERNLYPTLFQSAREDADFYRQALLVETTANLDEHWYTNMWRGNILHVAESKKLWESMMAVSLPEGARVDPPNVDQQRDGVFRGSAATIVEHLEQAGRGSATVPTTPASSAGASTPLGTPSAARGNISGTNDAGQGARRKTMPRNGGGADGTRRELGLRVSPKDILEARPLGVATAKATAAMGSLGAGRSSPTSAARGANVLPEPLREVLDAIAGDVKTDFQFATQPIMLTAAVHDIVRGRAGSLDAEGAGTSNDPSTASCAGDSNVGDLSTTAAQSSSTCGTTTDGSKMTAGGDIPAAAAAFDPERVPVSYALVARLEDEVELEKAEVAALEKKDGQGTVSNSANTPAWPDEPKSLEAAATSYCPDLNRTPLPEGDMARYTRLWDGLGYSESERAELVDFLSQPPMTPGEQKVYYNSMLRDFTDTLLSHAREHTAEVDRKTALGKRKFLLRKSETKLKELRQLLRFRLDRLLRDAASYLMQLGYIRHKLTSEGGDSGVPSSSMSPLSAGKSNFSATGGGPGSTSRSAQQSSYLRAASSQKEKKKYEELSSEQVKYREGLEEAVQMLINICDGLPTATWLQTVRSSPTGDDADHKSDSVHLQGLNYFFFVPDWSVGYSRLKIYWDRNTRVWTANLSEDANTLPEMELEQLPVAELEYVLATGGPVVTINIEERSEAHRYSDSHGTSYEDGTMIDAVRKHAQKMVLHYGEANAAEPARSSERGGSTPQGSCSSGRRVVGAKDVAAPATSGAAGPSEAVREACAGSLVATAYRNRLAHQLHYFYPRPVSRGRERLFWKSAEFVPGSTWSDGRVEDLRSSALGLCRPGGLSFWSDRDYPSGRPLFLVDDMRIFTRGHSGAVGISSSAAGFGDHYALKMLPPAGMHMTSRLLADGDQAVDKTQLTSLCDAIEELFKQEDQQALSAEEIASRHDMLQDLVLYRTHEHVAQAESRHEDSKVQTGPFLLPRLLDYVGARFDTAAALSQQLDRALPDLRVCASSGDAGIEPSSDPRGGSPRRSASGAVGLLFEGSAPGSLREVEQELEACGRGRCRKGTEPLMSAYLATLVQLPDGDAISSAEAEQRATQAATELLEMEELELQLTNASLRDKKKGPAVSPKKGGASGAASAAPAGRGSGKKKKGAK